MSMTLANIITEARYRADMENSTFVTDAELITYVNKSLGELYDLLISAYGDDYFISSDANVTVANTKIDLPTDYYKSIGVDMAVNGTTYALGPFSYAERNKYQNESNHIIHGVPRHRYRIVGSELWLYPSPEAGYTVTLWYVPRMTDLTTGDSTDNAIIESWIEYVTVDVAIKALLKEESDVAALLQIKGDIVQRIAQTAKDRDRPNAELQQDTLTTLFNLRTQTRHRSNTLNKPEVVSDTELNTYINQSMWSLQDLLIGSYGTEHFVDGYELSTVVGEKTIDLPINFHRMVGLDMVEPVSGNTYSLQKFNFNERNIYKNATDFIVDGVPRYRYKLLNVNIQLAPAPEKVYSMTLWYIPRLDKLTSDIQTLNTKLIEDWSEYIIVDAAMKIAQKTGGDVGSLKASKDELMQRISSIAQTRNLDQPEIVQDSDITLFNLRSQSRYRADMLNNDKVTDTELNHYINNSLVELHDALIQSYGTEHFIDGYSLTTEVDKQDIDLPDDFHRMVGLDMVEPVSGKSYSLQKFNFNERNIYKNATDFIVDGVPRYRYRLIKDHMQLSPAPEKVYNMTLWYIPQLTKLTSDTSKLDKSIIKGWEEYVIIDAAIKMKTKIGGDITALGTQKAAMMERITKMASTRNLDQPEVVQDSDITLFNLQNQARYRADMLHSDVVTDTELNSYINNSLLELYDLLVQSYGTEHFINSDGYSIATVVGQTDYQTPDDVYRTIGLDMSYDSKWHSLSKFNWSERNVYENATDFVVDGIPRYRYRLVDDTMKILPAPEKVYDLRLWYIPQLTKLTDDTSKLDSNIIKGWEEYIIIDAAIKMKVKANGDVTALAAQKGAISERITKMSATRNLDQPEVTQDANPTLFNLRIQSRYRANMLNSDAVTDTELNHYVNNSLGELHGLLVKAYGNDYFLDGYEFSTEADRSTYNLPTDFFKLGGVELVSTSDTYTLSKINWSARNRYKNSTLLNRGGEPYFQYRVMDKEIKLFPTPNSVYTIKVWYTPQLTKLTSDTDQVHGSMVESWLEYVVIDAAIKMLTKTGGDISTLAAQKGAMLERIITTADNRDWGEPETVSDVMGHQSRGWYY